MRPRVAWNAGRAACASLALAVLAGCGFAIPMQQSSVVPRQAERGATLRLGESTRAEVRAALGDPWFHSGRWRVEVYRADDKRTELGFMMAIVVPVPVGVFREKRHGYVLVTYDDAGRVSRVSSGIASEGLLAEEANKWLVIRADDMTFAVERVRTKWRPTLLADSGRLPSYLAERGRAAGCTLVVACDEGQGCPDVIAVDDGEPIDPSPITVLCAPDEPCPTGSRLSETEFDGKRFVLVPVVHAIGVEPGRHGLRVTSSVLDGSGEASFECAGGQVLYGIVRSRVEGATWWSKGTLQATVSMSTVPPDTWGAHSLALNRNGRWLVDAETEANGPGDD